MGATSDTGREGLALGLGAYLLWGFLPLYWKLLLPVPAFEILAHRMAWSVVFLWALLAARRSFAWVGPALGDRRLLAAHAVAALLLAFNWGLYIWAVNAGFVVETSLGYFINPLLNVAFGAAFLGERPRPGQWAAIGLGACGVLYLTFAHGAPPWISLALATAFATYGLLKKKATALGAVEGLTLESTLVVVPSIAYVALLEARGEGSFLSVDGRTTALLVLSGVATALPLLLFAAAVRRLTLTTAGVLQYVAPTLQFLLGVFAFSEPFDGDRLVGFAFIWAGLAAYTAEGVRARRRAVLAPASVA